MHHLKKIALHYFLFTLFIGMYYYGYCINPAAHLPTLKLIENKGQWDAEVICKADIPGGSFFITKTSLVYALIDENALHEQQHNKQKNQVVKGHNYKMRWHGGNTQIGVVKEIPSTEQYNYFIGNNTKTWASNCNAYQKVTLVNIYNNIDLEILAMQDFIKINFLVKPGANPSNIQLIYEGINSMNINDGALHIQTSVANVKEEKPIAFQSQSEIKCEYALSKSTVSFLLKQYNPNELLIIDPSIIFATYSGSVADNFGFTSTYDEAGNGYAGGTVYSQGFPTVMGAYQLNFGGGGSSAPRDIGILKFNAAGTQLLYATYLGGADNEQPHSIICNAAGELYILGTTESFNFPTSATAVDKFHGGKTDIFISKLSINGNQLLSSTYWGGTDDDGINGVNQNLYNYSLNNPLTYNYGDFYRGEIKLDKNENVVVVSSTQSSTSEQYVTTNGFQNSFGGGFQDGCIFKLNPTLSTILFSSYLGGTGEDAAFGVVFDSFNNIFVTGGTTSNNIGKNEGSLTYKGNVDAYIAKISSAGFSLQKLIYLGTPLYDQSYFIETDNANNIYITGQTNGAYPVKGNVFKTNNGTQFISILNNGLDSIKYSTVLGNGQLEINFSPSAFMVDNCGKIYLSGWGGSTNQSFNSSVGNTVGLPVTNNAYMPTSDGSDFYFIVLSKNLFQLQYATFMGGSFSNDHVDGGTSRFDKKGILYQSICAGCGGYSDLPTTISAYSRTNKGLRPNSTIGGCNNALIKFLSDPSDRAPIIRDTIITIFATDTVNFSILIEDPDGDSVTTTVSSSVLLLANNPLVATKTIGANFVSINFNWKTLCSNASLDTIKIDITAIDNGCFTPKQSNGKINIIVKKSLSVPPYLNCLKTQNDSTINLEWNNNVGEQKHNKGYIIYKKIGNNPYAILNSTLLKTDSTLMDKNAANHLTQNICYYVKKIGVCDTSAPSRIICSLVNPDSALLTLSYTKDTTLFITATDTLNYQFTALGNDPQDSLFIIPSGTVLTSAGLLQYTSNSYPQKTTFSFSYKSSCQDINRIDTLRFDLLIRDNKCPQSLTKKARINIVVILPPKILPPIMRCVRSEGSNTTLVRWEIPQQTNNRYFLHYVLLKKIGNNNWQIVKKISSLESLSYIDDAANNNEYTNICYTAYSVNICAINGDTAAITCTVDKPSFTPPPIYIYTTTVENNKTIAISWQKSNQSDFLKYRILKKDNQQSNIFYPLTEFNSINDTLLIDEKVNVQEKAYCYLIKQLNDCGIQNIDGYISCSILLKGKSIPFNHTLQWNDYDYWRNGLEKYDILRQEPNAPNTVISSSGYKQTTVIDANLNKDNGQYFYTIAANELKSPFTSFSNTIELIQSPILHVPNAFTPNGDGINDDWHPNPVFVKDYTLKLFDRWGKLIFETNNKYEYFGGLIQNLPATSDVFVYVITYTGWDGSSKTVTGNVTLLR